MDTFLAMGKTVARRFFEKKTSTRKSRSTYYSSALKQKQYLNIKMRSNKDDMHGRCCRTIPRRHRAELQIPFTVPDIKTSRIRHITV